MLGEWPEGRHHHDHPHPRHHHYGDAQQLINALGEWREGRAREAAESRELEVGIVTAFAHVILIILYHCIVIDQ